MAFEIQVSSAVRLLWKAGDSPARAPSQKSLLIVQGFDKFTPNFMISRMDGQRLFKIVESLLRIIFKMEIDQGHIAINIGFHVFRWDVFFQRVP